MFVPYFRPPYQFRHDLPGYVTANDLAGDLDDVTLAQLARQCEHVALDGGPCWSADELISLFEWLPPV